MTDPLTPAVSDRICKHMNDDHADAVLLYARVYGGVEAATAATMLSVDAQGMTLQANVGGTLSEVRVPFSTPLNDSEAVHHALIDMLKQARSRG